ncbi:FxLYD domain-containing protein [Thermus sp. PS18]|uniref:FxLYD domain-containing protein n=1 Tax=Thermus sp. PS18 TaxID=2849039 RepID=UPI0022650A7A|nr:FxLYD domain-containing protein [Thermus sp. PS18]UZX16529.1 FxLYD domain-containing protein [Thermus sp. PS18]
MFVVGAILVTLGVIGLIASPIMWVLGNKNAKIALRNGVALFLIGSVLLAMDPGSTQPTNTSQPTQTTQPANPTQPSQSKPAPEKRPALELLEASSNVDQYGARYVVGKIRNNTKRTYSYVQVEINLYDKNGNQVGSTLANVNNLEPGAVWSFKAPIFEEEATQFKVADITGF